MGDYFVVKTPAHDKTLYGTEKYINNYSYFFTDRTTKIISGMNCLDHIVCSRNVEVVSVAYSWDFIKDDKDNDYPKEIVKGVTKWNIPRGKPDHAILKATIRIAE